MASYNVFGGGKKKGVWQRYKLTTQRVGRRGPAWEGDQEGAVQQPWEGRKDFWVAADPSVVVPFRGAQRLLGSFHAWAFPWGACRV